jgi:hypothetical protein
MKKIALYMYFVLAAFSSSYAQITSPAIRANFGVDADLRANFFDSFVEAGSDDWFRNNAGPGNFIIDTTGAAYLMSQYSSKPAVRMYPFFRGMRYPQLSVINNRLLLDAIFIRDHHGDDSTVFATGSNKNGQHPGTWTTPVSQGIPDKNDILDMFMHARRDGPNLSDSLWLFGAVSLDAITGNRYFDFEMYQTDITYNRSTLSFTGYGPDEGHTSWTFDAAGNILTAGDVVFTAEYSSSALSLLQARIWVHKDALLKTPASFTWGGAFDGATSSSNYGYASILPKTGGTFYTGMQCGNNTWAGPFGVVLQNNALASSYDAKQLMEFSVNLSKLGLDHLSRNGDPCTMPFRRILVKSRASTSFTAELKDFVGPFDFFRAPRAAASATIPVFCGSSGYSNISVNNPLPTSLYTWTTTDGNIVGTNVGPAIDVNMPGSYVVSQELMDSCGTSYARDTVVVQQDLNCSVLKTSITRFAGNLSGNYCKLSWSASNTQSVKYFEVEKSYGGGKFSVLGKLYAGGSGSQTMLYSYADNLSEDNATVYYRLKITDINGNIEYSNVIAINPHMQNSGIRLVHGLSGKSIDLVISSSETGIAKAVVYNMAGAMLHSFDVSVMKGNTVVALNSMSGWKTGVYVMKVNIGHESFTEKMVLAH